MPAVVLDSAAGPGAGSGAGSGAGYGVSSTGPGITSAIGIGGMAVAS